MLTMVKYLDGSYEMVVSYRLDGLLKSGRVLAFRRMGGWARVGKDPLRKSVASFHGEDRRNCETAGSLMA